MESSENGFIDKSMYRSIDQCTNRSIVRSSDRSIDTSTDRSASELITISIAIAVFSVFEIPTPLRVSPAGWSYRHVCCVGVCV